MRETPKLRSTRDYDIFQSHLLNREIRERPLLLESMQKHGFLHSEPLRVEPKNGSGKHPVVKGHHRLHYAKRLKLPVFYVVDDKKVDIYELEADSAVKWDLHDFLFSRARAGDESCRAVLAFQQKHGIPQSAAISLIGGESADSKNKDKAVKKGTFRVAADLSHARAVVDITDHFREGGVAFATQGAFVKAVSKIVRVPEFDAKVLKHRLAQAPGMIQRQTNTEGYLAELEALYNYGAKGKRVSLKFRAQEVGRERQATFGGKQTTKRTAGTGRYASAHP